jgi:hypothetical protein
MRHSWLCEAVQYGCKDFQKADWKGGTSNKQACEKIRAECDEEIIIEAPLTDVLDFYAFYTSEDAPFSYVVSCARRTIHLKAYFVASGRFGCYVTLQHRPGSSHSKQGKDFLRLPRADM